MAERPVEIAAKAMIAAALEFEDEDGDIVSAEPGPLAVAALAALHAAGYPVLTDDIRADIRTAARTVRSSSWPLEMAEQMEQVANRLDRFASTPGAAAPEGAGNG